MDIMGVLSVVKQTIDITKDLRNIDEKIDAATWKLRLSEIIDKLIEAKDALIDAKERERELTDEITELKKALVKRSMYRDRGGLLFEIGEDGAEVGAPYCNHCFVKEAKTFRLRHHASTQTTYAHYKCDNCKVTIQTGASPSWLSYEGPAVV